MDLLFTGMKFNPGPIPGLSLEDMKIKEANQSAWLITSHEPMLFRGLFCDRSSLEPEEETPFSRLEDVWCESKNGPGSARGSWHKNV